MSITRSYLLDLLRRYSPELKLLSHNIQAKYQELIDSGYGATFSDFEGEIIYCLIRQRRPTIVYEISPDCGYSTIYLYEAIRKNEIGKLYSFEIEAQKRGKPTLDVIKHNALSKIDDQYYQLVIGDASKVVSDYPDPAILLIDSCHEEWFGKWYWDNLLPRVTDVTLMQDILFWDRPEYSEEAKFIISKITEETTKYISLGVLERGVDFMEARREFSPRRSFQTNSILLSMNDTLEHVSGCLDDPLNNNNIPLDISDEDLSVVENHLIGYPVRQNNHRAYVGLSSIYESRGDKFRAKYYWSHACASALSDIHEKSLCELMVWTKKKRRPFKLMSAIVLGLLHRPQSVRLFIRYLLGRFRKNRV